MSTDRVLRSNADAVSDVVGTIASIAVVVSLVATATIATRGSDAPEPVQGLPMMASAETRVGASHLVLTHDGGEPVSGGDVRLVVTSGALTLYDGPLGATGTWATGESVMVTLDAPVPGETDLVAMMTLRDGAGGTGAAAVRVDPTTLPPTSGTPIVSIRFDNGLTETTAAGLDTLRVRAIVEHSSGRKLVSGVTARLAGMGHAVVPLHDDGTHGDLLAADGTYTGYFRMPLDVVPGTYPLTVTARDLQGGVGSATGIVRIGHQAEPTVCDAPFVIRPDGGVASRRTGPLVVEVIGVDITWGKDGPRIPVRAHYTNNEGASYHALYAGLPVAAGMQESFLVHEGDVLGVRGVASGFGWTAAYTSFDADPHVAVLKNGDPAPDVPAYGTVQQDIATYLAPYVRDGYIVLEDDEVIVLFEFVENLNSEAADYQDLVMLFDFVGDPCAREGPEPTLFPDGPSNVPCTALPGGGGWFEVKADPPRDGVFTGPGITIWISNFDGKSFDWNSDVGVDAVYVKAGADGSHLYVYDPEAYGDVGLTSPGAVGNEISHISFCYD